MTVIGYQALHYGLPYVEWSIRSVINAVDEFYVLYSPRGSHNGHSGTMPCPDSEADLYEAAKRAAGDKLRWVRGDWSFEGQQRETIHRVAPHADIILVVDYDEVWPPALVAQVVADARMGTARRYRVPMVHFYRSFRRAVLHDPAYPERVIVPGADGPTVTLDTPLRIAHLGYAIPMTHMRYKWHGIHGHQGELRLGWIDQVYADEARRTDLHPVGSEFWNVEEVNPLDYLPDWMAEHPYFHLDVIP